MYSVANDKPNSPHVLLVDTKAESKMWPSLEGAEFGLRDMGLRVSIAIGDEGYGPLNEAAKVLRDNKVDFIIFHPDFHPDPNSEKSTDLHRLAENFCESQKSQQPNIIQGYLPPWADTWDQKRHYAKDLIINIVSFYKDSLPPDLVAKVLGPSSSAE